VQLFKEAVRRAPSIVYAPDLPRLWDSTGVAMHHLVHSLITGIREDAEVLILATCGADASDPSQPDFPAELASLFAEADRVEALEFTAEERRQFFAEVIADASLPPPADVGLVLLLCVAATAG
jgi:hypothetical protein